MCAALGYLARHPGDTLAIEPEMCAALGYLACNPGDTPAIESDCLEELFATCRYCLCTEGEAVHAEQRLDEFVDPCPCRGSGKYVHLGCLVQHFKARGDWKNFKCPTCRHFYTGKALRELAQISNERMIQEHGRRALAVADSLSILARAEGQLGNHCQCKMLLEESLDIKENQLGKDHIATAPILVELASAHAKLGDVQCQRELLMRSLAINQKYNGSEHISITEILNNLSTAHLGDAVKEREMLERSLSIREQHFGKGHIKTAVILNNLAIKYGEAGDLPMMRQLLERSLEIKERHFGPDHVESCLTLANLGLACCGFRDVSLAREFIARALATCRKGCPNSHRHGVVLLRAAAVHCALGEVSLSETYSSSALQMLGEVLGAAAGSKVQESEKARQRALPTSCWCEAKP